MYNSSVMKKAWHIDGYTFNGEVYCRSCVAETINDPSFNDPYTLDEHHQFTPIFASDNDDDLVCEYCFSDLD
jgi:hypothetical protein